MMVWWLLGLALIATIVIRYVPAEEKVTRFLPHESAEPRANPWLPPPCPKEWDEVIDYGRKDWVYIDSLRGNDPLNEWWECLEALEDIECFDDDDLFTQLQKAIDAFHALDVDAAVGYLEQVVADRRLEALHLAYIAAFMLWLKRDYAQAFNMAERGLALAEHAGCLTIKAKAALSMEKGESPGFHGIGDIQKLLWAYKDCEVVTTISRTVDGKINATNLGKVLRGLKSYQLKYSLDLGNSWKCVSDNTWAGWRPVAKADKRWEQVNLSTARHLLKEHDGFDGGVVWELRMDWGRHHLELDFLAADGRSVTFNMSNISSLQLSERIHYGGFSGYPKSVMLCEEEGLFGLTVDMVLDEVTMKNMLLADCHIQFERLYISRT